MPSYTETCGHLLLVHLAIDPILLVQRTIEHEQILRTDPNNSEIRYTKITYFPDTITYLPVYTTYSPWNVYATAKIQNTIVRVKLAPNTNTELVYWVGDGIVL